MNRLQKPLVNGNMSLFAKSYFKKVVDERLMYKFIISLYATGRYEEAWGKDCLEFKPERWISEKGSIVHIPSYKFICFNVGPRTCLGKDLSFIQMKIVASSILRNYRVHLVEHHPVAPSFSIALLMRYGLKVRITKRGMEE